MDLLFTGTTATVIECSGQHSRHAIGATKCSGASDAPSKRSTGKSSSRAAASKSKATVSELLRFLPSLLLNTDPSRSMDFSAQK